MRTTRHTEEIVRSVPEPEFTQTWHPISHEKLLDAMEGTVKRYGTEVLAKDYTLSEDGLDLFGTWTLDTQYDGGNLNIGFRNSMKKHFAVGFCAGRFVYVCSNLQFVGEFVEFRRHTGRLDFDELKELSNKSFLKVYQKMIDFANWHNDLKNYVLSPVDFKVMTFNAMKSKAFPPSKFVEFNECYKEEKALNGANLFSFYGGVTRLIRGNSLFSIQQSTAMLNKVVDEGKLLYN